MERLFASPPTNKLFSILVYFHATGDAARRARIMEHITDSKFVTQAVWYVAAKPGAFGLY